MPQNQVEVVQLLRRREQMMSFTCRRLPSRGASMAQQRFPGPRL